MTHLQRTTWLSVLCGALLTPVAAGAQSLLDLYEAARTHDAAFQSAKAQFDANQARADQARAGLLPTANLGATVSHSQFDNSNPSVQRNFGTQSATLSASHPLYRRANRITAEQAERQRQQAELQLTQAAQDLILRVSQAYFDVLGARDTLAFVQAQKTAVAEQLASARRNFEVGTATITDTREAQARFDLVTAQEIAAENDLRVKRLSLDTLVGRANTDPKPLSTPITLPSVQPASVEEWVGQSEQASPAVGLARLALDVARLETDKAKAGKLPTVDLTASHTQNRTPQGSSTSALGSRTQNTTVGVTLNLPLFTGYAVENRIRETLSLQEKAAADLEAARRGTAQATRSAFFGVVSGLGQVKALEAAESSSQLALDANKLGYQVGVRINIDVLNAQSQLFQTKRDLAVARYNVLLGSLRLRQANGSLKPEDLQTVNSLVAR
ncbi:MAG: TolC family outer membrane protein [Burkholderiaceae bacterium]|jgi:outer membrane protein